jgi:hypothetical protein
MANRKYEKSSFALQMAGKNDFFNCRAKMDFFARYVPLLPAAAAMLAGIRGLYVESKSKSKRHKLFIFLVGTTIELHL